MTPDAQRETQGEAARPAIVPIAQSLPAGARSKLSAYLDLLAKWNRVYNLTAIRDRTQMQSLHVDDALAVLRFLPDAPHLRLLDVGSGGGVPGIPLAISQPGWDVVLLDSNRKKVSFLTQAAIELRLDNVQPVASRIEDYVCNDRFDVVISRAFSDLASFARGARAHVAPGGVIVAMKGVLPQDEIEALPGDIGVVATPALDVPGLDAERHLVIMQPKGGPA
ncbi:MAG TPA: 16S rRNA (guanine(527)-N(7))-methyltransferase RsmG [Casimicrobiaceae bacterium]|nr:16S rRNA (guanine(527)-N(7))-methyltransferase RsmG [Casimicrobiaceae bacterium]